MEKIILLVETGADVPAELAKELGIEIVPMHVEMNGVTLDDGAFPVENILDYYKDGHKLPKTSGSTPFDFEAMFDRLQDEHPDAKILYLAYSAVTTCSCQSAIIASAGRENITIIDTKQVSIGQGMIAIELAKMLRANPEMSFDEVVAAANDMIAQAKMCFLPDNLEFLRAGGRCSNAAAIVGGLLKLKPCIELLDGKLVATKKYRGLMKKVFAQVIEEYAEHYALDRRVLYIVYTVGLADEVRLAAEETAKAKGFAAVEFVRAGGVITTHGGPAAIGMAGFTKK
ncbi:MAG: DegV family protein [Oscillospiraceae bacterium]|nr:DegV family protein [Oscillospiraceae bacterium]